MNPERGIPGCGIPGCKIHPNAQPKVLSWSDVHDGDTITVRRVHSPYLSIPVGSEFTGPAYRDHGSVMVMGNVVDYGDGRFVLLHIEKRALPQKVGTVLLDVAIDGVTYHAAVRVADGTWFIPTRSSGQWVGDCAIESYVTSYTP